MRKDIPGYVGRYQADEEGNIWSLPNCRYSETRLMRNTINRCGYKLVSINKDNKGKTFLVHRLVAAAFIPNPYNKETVNHIDGNKTNNHVSNLEWCTRSENQYHAHRTGLRKVLNGEQHGKSKLSESDIIKIRTDTRSHRKILKDYNISQSTICQIKTYKTWKHIS